MTTIRSAYVPACSLKDRVNRRVIAARAGLPAYVDAAPVRAHVDRLIEIGVTPSMIAQQVGVTGVTVTNIRDGAYPTVQYRVAAAVLAADHHPSPSMLTVLACGASRRLHALSALGWTVTAIGAEIGMSGAQISFIHRRQTISWRTWARVRDAYERLSAHQGPSSLTAKRAAARGLMLPLEWEGYDIDDPRVVPPRARRTAGVAIRDQLTERRERVAELGATGLTIKQIAEQLGVTTRTVERDRAAVAA